MAKEYFSWSVKLLEWRQDLIFDQRYRNSKDESEKAIFGLTKNPAHNYHPVQIIAHEWKA
jgi:hypothetical protein